MTTRHRPSLDVPEHLHHPQSKTFGNLWTIQEETQLLGNGQHELMDRGEFGLATALANYLFSTQWMKAIQQALAMLVGHHRNSPMLPGQSNRTTNGWEEGLPNEPGCFEVGPDKGLTCHAKGRPHLIVERRKMSRKLH